MATRQMHCGSERDACLRLEMPADSVHQIDKMRDARWKQTDEMESADWMEIWGGGGGGGLG